MAKIYEKASHVKDTYKKYIKICIILAVTGIAILMFTEHSLSPFRQEALYNIGHIIQVLCFMGAAIFLGMAMKYRAGAQGKKTTLNLMKQLPDSYRVVTNTAVEYEGKRSQLDTVIICPKGVFVVQTKNHNGTIGGNYSDKNWTQYKVGQKGGEYSKQFYSPVKQVSTHVYRLSNVLKQKGINVWVQGIVYFSNPAVNVQVHGMKPVPILVNYSDYNNEIADYISEYKNKKTLSTAEIEQITKILL